MLTETANARRLWIDHRRRRIEGMVRDIMVAAGTVDVGGFADAKRRFPIKKAAPWLLRRRFLS